MITPVGRQSWNENVLSLLTLSPCSAITKTDLSKQNSQCSFKWLCNLESFAKGGQQPLKDH